MFAPRTDFEILLIELWIIDVRSILDWSADVQVCFPTPFTGLPNDLSPQRPAAVGVAHKIRRAVLATAAGRVGGELYNYFYIFFSATDFSH